MDGGAAKKETTKKPAAKAAAKPAAKKTTSKPSSSKSKPAAKSTASPMSTGGPVSKPPVLSTPGAKMENRHMLADNIAAAFVLLFTKCAGTVNIMLVKESYDKWGAPGGGVSTADRTPDDTAAREFKEETGHEMPGLKKKGSFRFRNAHVIMGFTEDCIEPSFGKFKRKGDDEIKELRHIPCKDIYNWISNPTPNTAIRPIFISMLMENKAEIVKFCAECK